MMLQLEPPIPLDTPKGPGRAILVIDYGQDCDLVWTVVIDETGEVWSYRNPEVRAQKNVTMGVRLKPVPVPPAKLTRVADQPGESLHQYEAECSHCGWRTVVLERCPDLTCFNCHRPMRFEWDKIG